MTRTASFSAATFLVGLVLVGMSLPSQAAVVSVVWNDGDGLWNTATNWDPQVVPDNNDVDQYEVTINEAGAKVRLDEAPDGSWDVNSLVNHNELFLYDKTLTTTNGLSNHGTIYANKGTATLVGDLSNASGATVGVFAEEFESRTLYGSGTWTNQGEILIDATGGYQSRHAYLVASEDLTLAGTGRLHLASLTPSGSGPRKAYLQTAPGKRIINEITIDGHGWIEAELINQGTINANVLEKSLYLSGEYNKTNTGTMRATNGGTLRIEGITLTHNGELLAEDSGTVSVRDGGKIIGDSALEAALGGTFEIGSGGLIENCTLTGAGVFEGRGGTVKNVTIDVGVTLKAPSAATLHVTGSDVINHGTLLAEDGGTVSVEGRVTGDSPLTAASGGKFLVVGPDGLLEDCTLTGQGVFEGHGGTLTNVTIAPGATVKVDSRPGIRILYGSGTWNNEGEIQVLADDWYFDHHAYLVASEDLTLTGSGRVHLSTPWSQAYLLAAVGATVTNAPGHTIDGRGSIVAKLVNEGTIDANVASDFPLRLRGDDKTNTGTMRATAGKLWIDGITLTNQGTVRAEDGGTVEVSTTTLDPGTIRGGSLKAAQGGTFVFGTDGVVNGSLLSGQGLFDGQGGTLTDVQIAADTTVQVRAPLRGSRTLNGSGTWTNQGEILVDGWQAHAYLEASADLMLAGTGQVRLAHHSSTATRAYVQSAPGATITNGPAHAIVGHGYIEAELVNEGIIDANVSDRALYLSAENKTNNGTMRATAGTLVIDGIGLSNNGTLRAEDGGTVLVKGTILGGPPLEVAAGGKFLIGENGLVDNCTLTGEGLFEGRGGTLKDITIAPGATVTVRLNRNKLYGAGTWSNEGEILIEAPAEGYNTWAFLVASEDLILRGEGRRLQLLGHWDTNKSAYLQTEPGKTITNADGHTIEGYGRIEAALINNGTVRATADGAAALSLTINDKTNNGTMEAETGAKLIIQDITVANNGTLNAQGEIVLSGATIKGGELTGPGTFTVSRQSSGTLADVEIASDTTVQVRSDAWGARTLYGSGTWTNHGRVVVDGSVAYAYLEASTDLTLGGAGQIRLVSGLAQGTKITNGPDHTIGGRGGITAAIDNLGTIEANGGELKVTGTVAQWSGDTLTGGTWIARANSNLNVTNGSDITTNQGTVVLDGPNSQFHKVNTLADNQASFSILNGRDFDTVGDLTNSGNLTLGVGSTLSVNGSLALTDTSTYTSLVDGSGTGLIDVAGDAVLETGATVTFGVTGASPFRAGVYDLIVSRQPNRIVGTFSEVDGLGAYLDNVFEEGQTLKVKINRDLHMGDANLDWTTDVRDFNKWNAAKFTSGTEWTSGDFDGNGITDVRDFNKWNAYKFTTAPDPNALVEGQVPEPGTLVLLAVGALAIATYARHCTQRHARDGPRSGNRGAPGGPDANDCARS